MSFAVGDRVRWNGKRDQRLGVLGVLAQAQSPVGDRERWGMHPEGAPGAALWPVYTDELEHLQPG